MSRALSKNALRMIRGTGANACTQYSCGVVEKAKSTGVKIMVLRRNRKGASVEKAVTPRMVHRPDLLGVYGDHHKQAGQGKYIAVEAFPDGNQQIVVGAQHVNPYLREEGAYATIIETLKSDIGSSKLSRLRAKVRRSHDRGIYLEWEGKRNDDDCLVTSSWMTAEEIWEAAQRHNRDLLKGLKKSRSGRRGVKSHKNAKEKFMADLDVLRRATAVVNVATGETEYRGGATPYSKPLEQVGFAIDKRFLTYGVDSDGNELGDYFYRLVIGRSEPHVLRRSAWAYEGVNSTIAFKDEKARRAVKSRAA